MNTTILQTLRPWVVLLAALAQILASFLPEQWGWGTSIADQSLRYQTPAIPIGFAFAIWGLIFLASLAFAVFGLLPQNRNSALLNKIAWPAALLFALNALWEIYVPIRSLDWGSLLIITAALATALYIIFKIAKHQTPLTTEENWLVAAPMQVFAGWLSAATFVGIPSVLLWSGQSLFNPSADAVAITMIAAATALALYVIRRTRALPYAAAILWAIFGVAIVNITRESHPLIVWAAAAAACVVLADIVLNKLWQRPRI
jgi:hypothetical protein